MPALSREKAHTLPKLILKNKTAAQPDFMPDVLRIAAAAADRKAIELKAYDVRELTVIADSFVLCSASSEPQLKAILNAVRREMKEVGKQALHVEDEPSSGWMVLDYGDVIFHAFREEARRYYDLDGLWGDAPQFALDSILL